MSAYVPKPKDPIKYWLAVNDFKRCFNTWLRSHKFEHFNQIVYAIDRIVAADNDSGDETSAAHEFDNHMRIISGLGFREVDEYEYQLRDFRRPVDDEGNDL